MDIREIMKKHGVEIPDDKVDAFNSDFRVHYKSAGEHKKVKDSLTEAQTRLSANADYEGKYNTLYRKYEVDIAEKQKIIDDMVFDTKLGKKLAGVEFTSDRVRDSVISEIKGKGFKFNEAGEIDGLDEYLKNLRANEPDIFKAPDTKANTWAGGSSNSGVEPKTNDKSYVYKKVW